MQLTQKQYTLIIFLISSLLFIPLLGGVHLFDWDEINFAECAREMIARGDYSSVQINFKPFWEKPPLFIWMQVISMKLFGINEFAARFPNAACGIITLVFLFRAGSRLHSNAFGLLWTAFYACSFLPHLYFRSGIIDPWFNFFIFTSLHYFFLHQQSHSRKPLLFSAMLLGVAVLTKGPVALMISGICMTVFYSLQGFRNFMGIRNIFLFAAVTLVTGSAWFIILLAEGNAEIVKEFMDYQIRLLTTEDAGHGGPFFYHFLVLLAGCFPASVFALGAFRKSSGYNPSFSRYKKIMLILFWTVLILFSIVKTKIVHYSSLCYFPLSFLAADFSLRMLKSRARWSRIQAALFFLLTLTAGFLLTLAGFIEKIKKPLLSSGLIKDDFAAASLQAEVNWKGFEFLTGILFILFLLPAGVYLQQKKFKRGLFLALSGSLIASVMAIFLYVPKIEQYAQGAAIEFYQERRVETNYFETLGFKSYANLFYGKRPHHAEAEQLLNNSPDVPVYFVCKINRAKEYETRYPFLKELYRKNGFVFYKKELR